MMILRLSWAREAGDTTATSSVAAKNIFDMPTMWFFTRKKYQTSRTNANGSARRTGPKAGPPTVFSLHNDYRPRTDRLSSWTGKAKRDPSARERASGCRQRREGATTVE